MTLSSYRPGGWFGVFGSVTTLLLPASEKARVAALWSLIDDGADFDEVLDALLQSGLGALPGFVLMGCGGGPTKLLARGAVHITGTADGEEVRIDGRDALTWVERSLDAVESLSLVVGDDADHGLDVEDEACGPVSDAQVDLLILGGLVRVSRVDRPAAAAPPVLAAVPDPVLVPEPVLEPTPLDDEPVTARSGPAGPLDQPIDLPDEMPEAPEASTLPPPPPPAPAPIFADDPLTAPFPPADPLTDALPDPLLDQLADAPSDAPADPEAVDHDGLTRTGAAGEEFSRELPGIPGQPAAPRIVAPVATLRFSSGEVVSVDRAILVGRAPEARRFTSTEQPRLVKVPSPLYEISSTHLEVRPGSGADHGSAVVTDMGSTNGTVLDQPGLGPEALRPGIAVQLIPGATINLGDGVTIQVARP